MAGHDNSRSILQKCALIVLVVVQIRAEGNKVSLYYFRQISFFARLNVYTIQRIFKMQFIIVRELQGHVPLVSLLFTRASRQGLRARFTHFRHVSFPKEICDRTKCHGPLRYYEDLNCTPIYAPNDKCCPEAFDCSHLNNLSQDKCYVNGHEYNVGESLKPEHSNPCDVECRCVSLDYM